MVPEDFSLPTPGWYSDPSVASQVRWWDGEQWSQHVARNELVPRRRGAVVRSVVGGVAIALVVVGLVAVAAMLVFVAALDDWAQNK